MSPFEAMYGRQPPPLFYDDDFIPTLKATIDNRDSHKEVIDTLKLNLDRAKRRMKSQANKGRLIPISTLVSMSWSNYTSTDKIPLHSTAPRNLIAATSDPSKWSLKLDQWPTSLPFGRSRSCITFSTFLCSRRHTTAHKFQNRS